MRKQFLFLLLLTISIGSVRADESEHTGIFVWTNGASTCYKLDSHPTVTFEDNEGTMYAVLTLEGKEEPELTLPLKDNADLKIVYGTYVESPLLYLNDSGLATFSFELPIRITGGATACKVTYGTEPNTLLCTPITDNEVPAYTGILLKGTTENAPVSYTILSEAAAVTGNELKATTTSTGLAPMESALALKSSQFVTYTGSAFKPNRAYLPYTADTKSFALIFDGEQPMSISATPASSQVQHVGKYIMGNRLIIVKDGKQYDTDGIRIK